MLKRSVLIAIALTSAAFFGQAAMAEEGEIALLSAGTDIANTESLQRGARNFMNYCSGCHSMKYLRYSRMAKDLKIPTGQLKRYLLPADASPADYFQAGVAPVDAIAWFGKEPPDLSLIARSRGPDKVYRFLKTFYLDPSRPTRSNNLVVNNPAMPAVLSELEGVKAAVFKDKKFDHFVGSRANPRAKRSGRIHDELCTPGRPWPKRLNDTQIGRWRHQHRSPR